MNSSLLLNKIYFIQNQYRELLSSLLPKLQSSAFTEALDEINIFWIRNIDIIHLYLKTSLPSQDSYVFTASVDMGYDDGEHIPFLLIGNKHILDDPLSRYSVIYCKTPDGKEKEYLYNQIGLTVKDNLKILENLNTSIFIFPLKLLSQSGEYSELFTLSEHFFVDLFDDVDSLDDYFKKCDSFESLEHYAHENISEIVMFSENDDKTLPFRERFERAVSESQFIIDQDKTDAYNFFAFVYGNLQQAIYIVVSCLEYGCIPYIRHSVSLHYVLMIANCLKDKKEHISILVYKMCVGFAIHKMCDKEQFVRISTEEFLRRTRAYDFNQKLFNRLELQGITKETFLQCSIFPTLYDELQELYNYLAND